MKKTVAIAAIVLSGLAAFSAQAQQVDFANGYNEGDILLGFESTSIGKDYVIDLGQDLTSLPINATNDLASVFGSNWYQVSDLKYSVFAVPADSSYVIASVPQGAAAPVKKNPGQLGASLARVEGVGSTFTQIAQNGTGNNLSVGTYAAYGVNNYSSSSTVSWAANVKNLASVWSVYTSTTEASISNNITIYNTTGTTSTVLGTYQVTSAGVIQAVPEPSTYFLAGIGALALVVFLRRRNA